jgi:hypothetical protein
LLKQILPISRLSFIFLPGLGIRKFSFVGVFARNGAKGEGPDGDAAGESLKANFSRGT